MSQTQISSYKKLKNLSLIKNMMIFGFISTHSKSILKAYLGQNSKVVQFVDSALLRLL